MNNGHPSLMFNPGDAYHISLCLQQPSGFNAYSVGDLRAPEAVQPHGWWESGGAGKLPKVIKSNLVPGNSYTPPAWLSSHPPKTALGTRPAALGVGSRRPRGKKLAGQRMMAEA